MAKLKIIKSCQGVSIVCNQVECTVGMTFELADETRFGYLVFDNNHYFGTKKFAMLMFTVPHDCAEIFDQEDA